MNLKLSIPVVFLIPIDACMLVHSIFMAMLMLELCMRATWWCLLHWPDNLNSHLLVDSGVSQ